MLIREDTIAAIATAPGEGGIAIVRVSGPDAHGILTRCFARKSGAGFPVNRLCYGFVVDEEGAPIDEAMAVYMKAPHTYTREDVVEIHCHGGRVQARRVLERVMRLSARLAMPGEFTQRAFLNGRLDLSEAEAVMALIAAGSDAAARASMRQLEGGVSRAIGAFADRLTDLIALIGAGDDFPDEIEEQASADEVLNGAREIRRALIAASDERNARIVREGLTVVLTGRPNTGKSSLMNALLNSDRAIVTEHAGTTRDLLTEVAIIEGYRVTLMDTAGQRDALDAIERMGVERARGAERSADMVLIVLDGSQELTGDDCALLDRADERAVVVINKADLVQRLDEARLGGVGVVRVSAKTYEGLDLLRGVIAERAGAPHAVEGQLMLERHVGCARAAADALLRAERAIESGAPLDLSVIDLTEALNCLYEITGQCASEQVIERVFANFCVGK